MTTARQKRTHTFHIDLYSDIDEMRYQGTFTIKKLSLLDIAALGVRKAQLNGGMYYDQERPGQGVDYITDEFNSMLAHLELSITSAPKWWNLHNISDADLLNAVFLEVTKFEDSFLLRRNAAAANKSLGSDPGRGEADKEAAYREGVAGALVDEEVSAALEP